MGWAYGENNDGREIGYSVEALCDLEDCDVKIDRGLAYVCGGMHDGDEHGCGRYFCGSHLLMGVGMPAQLCRECADAYQENHPEEYEAALEEFRYRVEQAKKRSGVVRHEG